MTNPTGVFPLTFESIEARLWATETIDQVFFDTSYHDEASWCHCPKPRAQKPLPPTPPMEHYQIGSDHRSDTAALATKVLHSPASSPSLSPSSLHHDPPHPFVPFAPNRRRTTLTTRSASSASSSSTAESLSARSDPGILTSTGPRFSIRRHWTLDDASGTLQRWFTSELVQRERRAVQIWRDALHHYLLDPSFRFPPSRPSTKMTYCIISELLSTEESYLAHLSMFKQVFIDPFGHQFQKRFMTRELLVLFSYFPTLMTLSASLVRRWRSSMERQSVCLDGKVALQNIESIGEAFCDLEHEFKVYTHYAMQYTKAQKCLGRLERKPLYQQWIKTTLQNKEIKRMSLADYLISPVQRVTRYCLLVKDLMKFSETVDPNMERCYKSLMALALAMNDCQQ
ncbi:Dbl homology domain-containing protein [Hesseltinella vesiculosa]|uniref:Dbl homology domain-containing protein n=1 Tax=Hesseltinella vesiculosa TaxID=101127 RepID=A0A1X2G4T4_9FUNG|nr:Dbl homology domain-containing protein [Hesseltinella vesiculosa]